MAKIKSPLIYLISVIFGGVFLLLGWGNKHTSKSFTRIPVHFFPIYNRPYIDIEIEGHTYSCLVDLGSSHPVDLKDKYVKQILNKGKASESKYMDAKGCAFVTEKYLIPSIKIKNHLIENKLIYKENDEFLNKESKHWCSLWKRLLHQIELSTLQGRVGWSLFQKEACFFDFPHLSIFWLQNIPSSLKELGYCLDDFVSVPFQIENCGIVLRVEINQGTKRMCLDTGTTDSIIRKSSQLEAREKVRTTLKIGNQDFGNWHFNPFELSTALDCDGILGVDFFKKHAICFDFTRQIAYISRLEKSFSDSQTVASHSFLK